jgi:xylulokinase
MLADLYNCPVKTVQSKQGPALGVAILALVGCGAYKSVPEAAKAIVAVDKICEPIAANVPVYEKYYRLYDSIYPALKDSFAKLSAI